MTEHSLVEREPMLSTRVSWDLLEYTGGIIAKGFDSEINLRAQQMDSLRSQVEQIDELFAKGNLSDTERESLLQEKRDIRAEMNAVATSPRTLLCEAMVLLLVAVALPIARGALRVA